MAAPTSIQNDTCAKDAALREDFSAIVEVHISKVVRALVAEHDRIITALWKENQYLRVQIGRGAFDGSPDERQLRLQGDEGPMILQNDKSTNIANISVVTSLEPSSNAMNRKNSFDSSFCVDDADTYWKARVKRILRNGRFDSVIGGIIVLNALVMSLELEYSGRKFEDEVMKKCVKCEIHSDAFEVFFISMEHFFTGAFALELILRLAVQGCAYLRQVSNFLDAIIVVVSMADSWSPLGSAGGDVLGSVAILRLMRLMRLAKVLRVVRVMKAFKSLRVLVSAVKNSVGSLAWSMTLLFVLMLLGAIFMAQVIRPFMEETADEELRLFIFSRFGTWTNSMFTVFEITMAPGGFIQYRRLYEEVHPLFGAFCVLYVCLVTFAVVRVITAMFLKTTLSASDSEDQATARERSKEFETFKKMADVDGSGILTSQKINMLLSTAEFSKWMEEAGLTSREISRIFTSLDRGSHEVSFIEFETALQRMLGLPRAADVVINLYETHNIMDRVARMEKILIDQRLCADTHRQTKDL